MNPCRKCRSETGEKRGVCKPCWAAYVREWSRKNPERAKAIAKRTRDRHKSKKKVQDKKYREENAAACAERAVRWAKKNRERLVAYKKAWYLANKEKSLSQTKVARDRRFAADPEGERKKKAEYMRRRYQEPRRKIYGRMSALIRAYLKAHGPNGSKAGAKWESLVGYTLDELTVRLKATVPDGYTWDDYVNGVLEVDHIVPDREFVYQSTDDSGFKGSWALTNLRLLSRSENLKRRYWQQKSLDARA